MSDARPQLLTSNVGTPDDLNYPKYHHKRLVTNSVQSCSQEKRLLEPVSLEYIKGETVKTFKTYKVFCRPHK